MSTILITGANRGIGLELVRQYLEAGNRVYACCRQPDSASDLASLASNSKGNLSIHQMDVSDEQSIKACAKAPSANRRRKKFGILNATKNASDAPLAPK